jgi:hypothetical protein
MGAITQDDEAFEDILPAMIDAAELRIVRDLDPLGARGRRRTTVTTGQQTLGTPPDCLIMRGLWVFTPVDVAPEQGKRQQLLRRDETFIRWYWPSDSLTGVPLYYAELENDEILLAPTPSADFVVELALTARPPTISPGNPVNVVSSEYPDLMLYASMVFLAAYQRNFGQQADDPRMAMSWEQQYQTQLAAAVAQERRRRSEGWAELSPSTPPQSEK